MRKVVMRLVLVGAQVVVVVVEGRSLAPVGSVWPSFHQRLVGLLGLEGDG